MLRCICLLLAAIACLPCSATAQPATGRILVLPFDNARNEPRYHWLTEASAVLLTDGLRGRGLSPIARRERVRAFEELHLPVAASLSRATIIKVGQIVGAREVLVGSFQVDGDRLTVQAHSIRVDVGRVQPDVVERGELTELFAIFGRLSRKLAPDAGGSRPAEAQPPLGAFENYIKGLVAESPAAQMNFLETALEEHPEFDRARLALWAVYTDAGDHASALAVLEPIVDASSFSRRARFSRTVSLVELARYEEAFGALKTLLEERRLEPSAQAAVLNNAGVLLIRRGATPQTGSAAYYLTKAADLVPDADHMFNLGYAYALAGNAEGALYWLREVVRRNPGDADAHFVLAWALQATGSTVEAERERELAVQLSARYEQLEKQKRHSIPPGLERLAVDFDAAREVRAEGLGSGPAQRDQRELARFHLESGGRLFAREQDREAMSELRRAVYLSPYESEAHLLIGRIHLKGARFSDAIDALKISLWSEETVAARLALAEAYWKSGNATAARSEAERALALDPESSDARRLLAEMK